MLNYYYDNEHAWYFRYGIKFSLSKTTSLYINKVVNIFYYTIAINHIVI